MATNIELKYKSWATLPIGKYEQIKDIIRAGGEYGDIEVLAILCDCSVDDLLDSPVTKTKRLIQEAMFITKPLNVKDKLRYKTITIDGVRYVVHTDFRDVTTAQYMDYTTFYKDFEKNYCNVLACFIIPDGHKYNDGYDALEVAEIFREKLTVEVAENACFFFARRSKDLFLKGLRRLALRTARMEAKEQSPKTKVNLRIAREKLMKEIEDITGLGRLMKSPTQFE